MIASLLAEGLPQQFYQASQPPRRRDLFHRMGAQPEDIRRTEIGDLDLLRIDGIEEGIRPLGAGQQQIESGGLRGRGGRPLKAPTMSGPTEGSPEAPSATMACRLRVSETFGSASNFSIAGVMAGFTGGLTAADQACDHQLAGTGPRGSFSSPNS